MRQKSEDNTRNTIVKCSDIRSPREAGGSAFSISRTFVAALMSPFQMEMSSSSSAIPLVSWAASAVYFWMSAFKTSILSFASAMALFFSTVVSSQNCLNAAN